MTLANVHLSDDNGNHDVWKFEVLPKQGEMICNDKKFYLITHIVHDLSDQNHVINLYARKHFLRIPTY